MSKNIYTEDKLSKSLGETLTSSDLTVVCAEMLENAIEDQLLNGDLLKEIPIIGSIIGIGKTTKSVADLLLTKKIMSFLGEVSDISPKKRLAMISKIDNSEKYNQTVGGKLLYIIDRAQDHVTSQLIGKLFSAFLKGKITYREFGKASIIINLIDYYDLQEFLELSDDAFMQNGTQGGGLEEVDNFFIAAGLCSAETSEVEVTDQYDKRAGSPYAVSGGETVIYRTGIGQKIYNVLSSNDSV